MGFAALSTVIGVFENIVAFCHGRVGRSRARGSVVDQRRADHRACRCRASSGFNVWSGRAGPRHRRHPEPRGLHRLEQRAAAGRPGVCAVLHEPLRLGLEELPRRGRHRRQGPSGSRRGRMRGLRTASRSLMAVIFVMGYIPKFQIWLGMAGRAP